MQKESIPTDTTKRVDVYSLSFIIIKVSKIAQFLYFLLMTAKNQSQFEQNV